MADEPAGFQDADGINGGQLFDKFWADETGFDQNDPNLPTYVDNGNFFRCKQCHAWDHLGNAASYIDRAPKTSRPDVTGVNVFAIARDETAQELFDVIKTGDSGPRRAIDTDLSGYDPEDATTTAEGNRMPNFGTILTDEQIWDLVKYLKEEILDTTQLYDIMTEGTYPTGSRSFSDVGKDGDAANGAQIYARCAGCHGADGTTISLEGRSIGAFAREKPYELWHKVKFGQLGSDMGPQGVDTLEDMKDLLKATADPMKFPDLGDGLGGEEGNAPKLVGLDADKATVLPFTVQVAYNDDTAFFHTSWEGDKGDTHDYFRYKDGAWQNEGGVRRDAQATIDNDSLRGPTNKNSTIYESRVTFMLDDPNGPNAVAGFAQYGCAITCHDNSRAMPMWKNADGEVHKYLPDDVTGRLDLWHHRLGRANPIAFSDDQWVGQRTNGEGDGEGGSRHGDDGTGPFQTGKLGDDGNPPWAFDPATTGGAFAFPFDELFTSPLRHIVNANAENLGPNAPNPVGIDYVDAVAMGYVPSEGDTIPRRRLRMAEGSRGDITAMGTTFTPSADDELFGRWDSNIQRALDTGNDDDTALADGHVYNLAFAVHTGMVTVRDHYVSFAYTLSLDGGDADIQAVKIAGSGTGTLPDFSDTAAYPKTDLNLFLPGIASYEFLNGDNAGLEYIDPATGNAIDQNHGGSAGLTTQGLSCRDCHTASAAEAFAPVNNGGFFVGPMETLVLQRGGVNTPTPIPPQ